MISKGVRKGSSILMRSIRSPESQTARRSRVTFQEKGSNRPSLRLSKERLQASLQRVAENIPNRNSFKSRPPTSSSSGEGLSSVWKRSLNNGSAERRLDLVQRSRQKRNETQGTC